MENETVSKNFIEQMIDKDIEEGYCHEVHTRFPPEPNGYLHIGHAKSILLNYGLAQKYGGKFNLRFDDTNPTKEKTEFVEAIQSDIEWLGADWEGRLFFASDYFDQMYEGAVKLIKKGKAYVSDLSAEQIREYRGTLTEPGKEDPYPQKSDRSGYPPKQVMLKIHAVLSEKDREKRYLLKKTETITWETELPDKLPAPIQKNQKIGTLHAKLNGKELLSCLVTADDKIDRITYKWYVDKVFKDYFH